MTAPSDDEAAPRVTHSFAARPEQLYALLVDASDYPHWLVDAQQIRRVDSHWPAPGSGFDHSVGGGPIRLHGRTTVADVDPPWSLTLEAGLGWLGSFVVEFQLRDEGTSTTLEIAERPQSGLVARLWRVGAAPVMQLMLWGRNQRSLEHLEDELADTSRPT